MAFRVCSQTMSLILIPTAEDTLFTSYKKTENISIPRTLSYQLISFLQPQKRWSGSTSLNINQSLISPWKACYSKYSRHQAIKKSFQMITRKERTFNFASSYQMTSPQNKSHKYLLFTVSKPTKTGNQQFSPVISHKHPNRMIRDKLSSNRALIKYAISKWQQHSTATTADMQYFCTLEIPSIHKMLSLISL